MRNAPVVTGLNFNTSNPSNVVVYSPTGFTGFHESPFRYNNFHDFGIRHAPRPRNVLRRCSPEPRDARRRRNSFVI